MDEALRQAEEDKDYFKMAQLYFRMDQIPQAYDAAVQAFVEAGGHQSCLGNNPKCEGRVYCDDDGCTQYNYICLPHTAKDAHALIKLINKEWDAWDRRQPYVPWPEPQSRDDDFDASPPTEPDSYLRNPDDELRDLERRAWSGDGILIYLYLNALYKRNLLRPELKKLFKLVLEDDYEKAIGFLTENFIKHQTLITHCKCKKLASGPCSNCGVGLCDLCLTPEFQCGTCQVMYCDKCAQETGSIKDEICTVCLRQDFDEYESFRRNPDEEERRHEREHGKDEKYWVNQFRRGKFSLDGFRQITDSAQRNFYAKTWLAQLKESGRKPDVVVRFLALIPGATVEEAERAGKIYSDLLAEEITGRDKAFKIARLLFNTKQFEPELLEEINRLLDGHGVESVAIEFEGRENFFEYVNMGDTYAETIGYSTLRGDYVINSWGDWHDECEQAMHVTHCPNCGVVHSVEDIGCPSCHYGEEEHPGPYPDENDSNEGNYNYPDE